MMMVKFLPLLLVFAFGCTANKKHSNTMEMDLSDKKLHAVPDSVFRNTELTTLMLGTRAVFLYPIAGAMEPTDRNHLTYLPDSICTLTKLKKLCINFNDLESLPGCFSSLQELEILDLSNNYKLDIHQAMPVLLQLKKLKELNLFGIISVFKDSAWVRSQLDGKVEKLSITKDDLLKHYSVKEPADSIK